MSKPVNPSSVASASPDALGALSSASTNERVLFEADDIQRTLKRLAHELVEANQGVGNLVLLGIVTRGKPLAERLAKLLEELEGVNIPVGYLDITLYRDDTSQSFKPMTGSLVPVDLTGRNVILVDDVLFNGRSARAALDALNGYGRYNVVRLLVLLDRGHRELPIRPDFVGRTLNTTLQERVVVRLVETDGVDQVLIRQE